jgi:hypothetical protein
MVRHSGPPFCSGPRFDNDLCTIRVRTKLVKGPLAGGQVVGPETPQLKHMSPLGNPTGAVRWQNLQLRDAAVFEDHSVDRRFRPAAKPPPNLQAKGDANHWPDGQA